MRGCGAPLGNGSTARMGALGCTNLHHFAPDSGGCRAREIDFQARPCAGIIPRSARSIRFLRFSVSRQVIHARPVAAAA